MYHGMVPLPFEKNTNPDRYHFTYLFFPTNAIHVCRECALDG